MIECVWSNGGMLHTVKHRRNQRKKPSHLHFFHSKSYKNYSKTRRGPKLRFFAARSKNDKQRTTNLQTKDQESQSSAFDNIVVSG